MTLLGITAILAIASCGETPSTPLTSLTYSASTIDAFKGKAITAVTPTIVPKDATVEYTVSPPLPAGLELSPKSGIISGTPTDTYVAEAVYTVTATGTENSTGSVTAAITIAVGLSKNIVVTETAKMDPEKDRRYQYVVFTVKADGTTSMGRHKFALKLNTDTAPTVQEMNEGAGVYRIVNDTEKKAILSYSLSSKIRALATNSNYLGSAVKNGDSVDGQVVDVDSYLLTPGTSYTLYALKDGDSSVETVHSFTTDVFVPNAIPLTSGYINDPAMGGEYSYDMSDGILVLPFSLFNADSETYDMTKETSFARVTIVSGSSFWSAPQVTSRVAILTPSHFSDSTHHYLSINGKHIFGFFIVIPSSEIDYDTGVHFQDSSTTRLFTLTPTLDQ